LPTYSQPYHPTKNHHRKDTTMATQKAINDSIRLLVANGLQGSPATPERVQLVAETWAATLEDMTDAELHAAVLGHLRDPSACQFWPQPGKLMAQTPRAKLEAIDDSGEAWAHVLQLAEQGRLHREYGGEVEALSPAEEAGVDALGGRRVVATSSYDEHGWLSKRFADAYRAAKAHKRVEQAHPSVTDGQARGVLDELAQRRKAIAARA
jgi:hypothetical protein